MIGEVISAYHGTNILRYGAYVFYHYRSVFKCLGFVFIVV